MTVSSAPDTIRLVQRLSRETGSELLFRPADRGRYATDASIYQMMPIGVVVPKTIEDVAVTIGIAREAGVTLLARGAGTSQCGQTVNTALVMDCSKHLRRVLAVDPAAGRALVEPGISTPR